MDRKELIAIMGEKLYVNDEWGCGELDAWEFESNMWVDGIEAAVDAIIAKYEKEG